MDVEEATQAEQLIVGDRAVLHVTAAIEFFSKALPAVAAELEREEIAPTGPPITVYRQRNLGYAEMTAGFPVDRPPTDCTLARTVLPAGPVVRAVHAGPYDRLGSTYAQIGRWFLDHAKFPPATMWEQYVVGPADTDDPDSWRTSVVFPLC